MGVDLVSEGGREGMEGKGFLVFPRSCPSPAILQIMPGFRAFDTNLVLIAKSPLPPLPED